MLDGMTAMWLMSGAVMGFKFRPEYYVALMLFAIVGGIYAGLPSDQRGLRTPAEIEDDAYKGSRMVVFETDSCGWCRRFRSELAKDYKRSSHQQIARLTYAEFNYRAQIKFKINTTPTFVLFNEAGNEVDRLVGYPGTNSKLFRMVDRHRTKLPM